MARRTALIACVLLVLAGHLVAVDWLANQWQQPALLRPMPPPMFTRLLKVAAPPAPVATPAPAPARGQLATTDAAASVPDTVTPVVAQAEFETPVTAAAPDNEPTDTTTAQATTAASVTPAAPPVVPAAEPVASEPQATAADPLASWPVDTRLSYVLSGWYRGELQGEARVQWQRTADRYQVRVDVSVNTFMKLTMTSQGQATTKGLRPTAYEETRTGRGTRSVRLGAADVVLEGGRTMPRPDGLQDTASQFVELAWRFANQIQPLQLGGQISFPMARPGAIDLWTYDVVDRTMLQTSGLGVVEAFHLKPRPIANPRGNITAEMWFAPGLQYLPVRIRINQGSEVHLDLLVEKIEQR